jgi:uncharacterized membrane protein HdeD (DUF308 family)
MRHWWIWAIRGVLAIAFGVLTFIWPMSTVTVLVLFFGAWAFIEGIVDLVAAFGRVPPQPRWLLAVEGLAGIAAGVVTYLVPGITLLALIYVIGFWAIVLGAMRLTFAMSPAGRLVGRGWGIFGGIISVLFGIALFAAPIAGSLVLALWLGVFAIVIGVSRLVLAFQLRRELPRQPDVAAPRAA